MVYAAVSLTVRHCRNKKKTSGARMEGAAGGGGGGGGRAERSSTPGDWNAPNHHDGFVAPNQPGEHGLVTVVETKWVHGRGDWCVAMSYESAQPSERCCHGSSGNSLHRNKNPFP